MQDIIQTLKNQHLIWQADQTSTEQSDIVISSGYTELDHLLGGGFPSHGVVEIESQLAIGELRLLTSLLQQRFQEGMVVLLQPPAQVNAAFLAYLGYPLAETLVLLPDSAKKALWAAEQCLKSGACRCVLLWQNELEIHQVKRLQVASEQGASLLFVFRLPQPMRLSLPVSLSLTLQPRPFGLCVQVKKRKGGWSRGTTEIDFRPLFTSLTIPSATLPDSVLSFPVVREG